VKEWWLNIRWSFWFWVMKVAFNRSYNCELEAYDKREVPGE